MVKGVDAQPEKIRASDEEDRSDKSYAQMNRHGDIRMHDHGMARCWLPLG